MRFSTLTKFRSLFLFCLFFLNVRLFAFDHSHSQFSKQLKKYVQNGFVDYSTWKTNRGDLDSYLQALSAVSEKEYSSFSNSEKLSFLINAYNAFTICLILDHYPVKSIQNIGGLFSSPWKIDFFSLLGNKRTLDWIEHEKLRKDFQEPRIHFAINCASRGCPPLFQEPFQPSKLEKQLSLVTKKFLSDIKFNRYDELGKTLYLSKIFQWFEADFIRKYGNLLGFFNFHSGLSPLPSETSIRHLDYDWNLNERK
ncbi:DUF547 domain-containing protein [Leptospira sp. WS92.C1]